MLRLATWNCCGGPLEWKLAAARTLAADIAVVAREHFTLSEARP